MFHSHPPFYLHQSILQEEHSFLLVHVPLFFIIKLQAGGMDFETDYPYYSGSWGWTGFCKKDKEQKVKVKVGATTVVSSGGADEAKMVQEIQKTPMSICVDAEPWQTYRSGIISKKTCGTSLDHCVHLVGYMAKGICGSDKYVKCGNAELVAQGGLLVWGGGDVNELGWECQRVPFPGHSTQRLHSSRREPRARTIGL